MNPTNYGRELAHERILQPRTVSSGILSAPLEMLQLIWCNCQTSRCRTAGCSCCKLGCTIFCAGDVGAVCVNPITQHKSKIEASDMAILETDKD